MPEETVDWMASRQPAIGLLLLRNRIATGILTLTAVDLVSKVSANLNPLQGHQRFDVRLLRFRRGSAVKRYLQVPSSTLAVL